MATIVKGTYVQTAKKAAEFAADTTTIWSKNQLLIEEDTLKMKVGDGINVFSQLKYTTVSPTEVQKLIADSSHSHINKAVLDQINQDMVERMQQEAVTPIANVKATDDGAEITITDYKGTTKAEIKNGKVPSTLPNPNKLTFEGAVTAEYDGSSAVTIDLSQLSEEIADKATLENGVVKFWKASTEESRTDTLLYSVDISSIGGTGSEETDPNVPNWTKQPNKPTYTADEVGALPDTTKIPSKTSDLQNDSGFLTEHQDLSGYALKSEVPKSASDVGADAAGTAESKVSVHNTATDSHNDIRELISGLTQRLNALADSDDTTLDQMSEVVAYIKSNKSLIDAITTSKVNVSDIIDNLTTNLSNKVLSASMGVELKKLIDAINVPVNLSELAGDTTHRTVTDAEKTAWNNKSTFSGNYNDLTNKPSLFSGNYNDLSGKPNLITEERVNELINAKLPKSAEEVQY